MDISLTRELEQFIAEKVAAGQYVSASDVVRGALETVRAMEQWTPEDVAELRREVAIGIEQLDRGEGRPWSVEEIKSEGRRRLAGEQN